MWSADAATARHKHHTITTTTTTGDDDEQHTRVDTARTISDDWRANGARRIPVGPTTRRRAAARWRRYLRRERSPCTPALCRRRRRRRRRLYDDRGRTAHNPLPSIIAPRYFFLFIFFLLSSPQSSHGRRVLSLPFFRFRFSTTTARPPFYFLSIFSFSPAAPVLQPPHDWRFLFYVYTSLFRRSVSSYTLYGLHANRMICFSMCVYIPIYIINHRARRYCYGQSACATGGRLRRTSHGGGARRVVSASLWRADRFSLFFFFPIPPPIHRSRSRTPITPATRPCRQNI